MNSNISPRQCKTGRPRSGWRRGSVLVEAVIAMVVLSIMAIVLLRGSLVTLAPRQWTMIQNLTDAHMTFEKAFAERIEFNELTSGASPWPIFPDRSETTITLGTLPGGATITGTVIRSREADNNNFPSRGGTGDLSTNPAEIEAWRLQSHLRYRIGSRQYIKSRTVVRTR